MTHRNAYQARQGRPKPARLWSLRSLDNLASLASPSTATALIVVVFALMAAAPAMDARAVMEAWVVLYSFGIALLAFVALLQQFGPE